MADTVRDQAEAQPPSAAPVVVKKYANRRLYNTESSCYITLENLAEMVRGGRDFVVYDAKSGEDITRGVLTQIIVEEEGKGRNLLPTNFLRQLIGFYGDSMQAFVPRYLEHAMEALARQQDQLRETMQRTMGTLFPFGGVANEMSRQNMAMVERALSLFTPFYRPQEDQQEAKAQDAELAALRAEAERLRQRLAEADARASEVGTLRAELADRTGRLAEAERQASEAAALGAELAGLRKKLAEAEAQAAEAARLRAELEQQRRKAAESKKAPESERRAAVKAAR